MAANGGGNASQLLSYQGVRVTNEPVSPEANEASVPQAPLLVRTISMSLGGSAEAGKHHSLVGIILVVLGSFSFSCMFLFVKLLQGRANSFTVAFYRALVEVPIAVMLCRYQDDPPPSQMATWEAFLQRYIGPSHIRSWLCVRGGMGAAAVLCFFYAIQHLRLPDAVTLQFTTPPFAAAFAVCFVGERWQLSDKIGAVVCIGGVVLIAHPSWLFGASNNADEDSETDSFLAIAVALLGAAFAGLAYMSVRKIQHSASANVMVLFYSSASVPVALLGRKMVTGQWNVWSGGSNLQLLDWFWILLTGIFAYAGQYLTNLGLQHENAATGTLATCSQIVWTYFFETVFLHEGIQLWSVVGTLLILGYMVLVGVLKMNKEDRDTHEVAGEPEELALLFSTEHPEHAKANQTQRNRKRCERYASTTVQIEDREV